MTSWADQNHITHVDTLHQEQTHEYGITGGVARKEPHQRKTGADILRMLTEGEGKNRRPKQNGFPRFIGKAGGILVRAYGEADMGAQSELLKRFPDLGLMWKICCNNVQDGFCVSVMGAYMLNATPKEIEEEMKELGLWKDNSKLGGGA